MNPEENDLQTTVKEQIESIVRQGEDVRQQVSKVVAEQAEQFQQQGKGLISLSRAVMDSAVAAIDQAVPHDPDSVLRQVVDGLGDGLQQSALAAKLALEESQASARTFAAEDLEKLRKDLLALGNMFVETVSSAMGNLSKEMGAQVSNLTSHAEKTRARVLPGIQSALSAAAQHPLQFGMETMGAGVNLSRQAVGSLFSTMGHLMQKTGEIISGQPKT